MKNQETTTINAVSKHGGGWQVLKWDGGEWVQIGPYYESEAEAEAARAREATQPQE